MVNTGILKGDYSQTKDVLVKYWPVETKITQKYNECNRRRIKKDS